MNREILFRAKLKDWKINPEHNRWVEGFYLKRKETTYCFTEDYEKYPVKTLYFIAEERMTDWGLPNEFRCYEIDPDTLCQYVEQNDLCGNKIWENDILFDDDVYSLVRWNEEEARFVIDDYGTKGCLMEYGWDEDAGRYDVVDTNGFDDFTTPVSDFLKVVGNKFDNPELLKGENK